MQYFLLILKSYLRIMLLSVLLILILRDLYILNTDFFYCGKEIKPYSREEILTPFGEINGNITFKPMTVQ